MKCPKCGYNSFEFLDACKKCSAEFVSFKKSMGIKPVVFASCENSTGVRQQIADDAVPPDFQVADDESFTWDTSAPGVKAQKDKPFDGFNLDFIKTDAAPAAPDFSFNEVPSSDIPAETKAVTAEAFEGFSFDETDEPHEEPEAPPLFEEFEQEFQGAEDMDLAETPESHFFGDTGVKGELTVDDLIAAGQDSLAMGASEQSEQIFELDELFGEDEAKQDKKEEPAKNFSTSNLDFDKEFEAIFTAESSDTKEKQE